MGKRGSQRALQKFFSERKNAVEALNEVSPPLMFFPFLIIPKVGVLIVFCVKLDDRMRAWTIERRKLQAARLEA